MTTAYNLTLLRAPRDIQFCGIDVGSRAVSGNLDRERMGTIGEKLVNTDGYISDGHDSSCERHLSGLLYGISSCGNKTTRFRLSKIDDDKITTEFPVSFERFNDGSLWDYDLLRNDIDRRVEAIDEKFHRSFPIDYQSKFDIINDAIASYEEIVRHRTHRKIAFYKELSGMLIKNVPIDRITAARFKYRKFLSDLKFGKGNVNRQE